MPVSDKSGETFPAKMETGLDALKKGAAIGAPIHCMVASLGEGMIRHFPDGTRQRLVRINGEFTVVETLEPGIAVVPR